MGRPVGIQLFHGPDETFRIDQWMGLLSVAVAAGGFGLDQLHSRSRSGTPPTREIRPVGNFPDTEVREDALFRKDQLATRRTQVDLDNVAQADLAGSDQ